MTQKQEFIAEIGVNHEGSLQKCLNMIDALAVSGGSIAKVQIYKAEKLASIYARSYWDTNKESTLSQRELFKKYDVFGREEYITIKDHCEARGIEFMATFFDVESLTNMHDLVSRIKVASADITNFELLDSVSSLGKPIILSTGAASMAEVESAVKFCQIHGSVDISLLHCVLNYPTEKINASLNRIQHLKSLFPGHVIGYSDHTVPNNTFEVQLASAVLGAQILEKHFTLNKLLPGNDHYHAFDSEDLIRYFSRLDNLLESLNFDEGNFLSIQEPARQHARRGLFFKRPVKK